MKRFAVLGILAAGAVLFYVSCAPIPLPDGKRRVMLGALTTNVILPTYADVVARAEAMRTAIASLVANPSVESLDVARASWHDARVPWKEAESFAFGPVIEQRLGVALDQSPVEFSYVEAEIAGTAELTESYVESLGANRKGFHAIEYLLYGAPLAPGGTQPTDAEVLAGLSGDATPAVRRRTFIAALVDNLKRKADDVRAAWLPEAGGYATRFAQPGAAGAFPTVKAAIDTLVNEAVFLSELVANVKLGKPLGLDVGGVPQPALGESVPSDNSIADMVGNVRSIRNVYLGTRDGTPGVGLGSLVVKKSTAIDREARAAIDRADAAIAAIPRPYDAAVIDQRPIVEAAHAAVKDLKVVLATDVLGILGATLKFNDNDGD